MELAFSLFLLAALIPSRLSVYVLFLLILNFDFGAKYFLSYFLFSGVNTLNVFN